MSASVPLRVVVVGAGAFGRNHLRVYRELQQAGKDVELVGVVDRDPAALAIAAAKFEVPGFETIDACLASTGTPTASNILSANPCTSRGEIVVQSIEPPTCLPVLLKSHSLNMAFVAPC